MCELVLFNSKTGELLRKPPLEELGEGCVIGVGRLLYEGEGGLDIEVTILKANEEGALESVCDQTTKWTFADFVQALQGLGVIMFRRQYREMFNDVYYSQNVR